MEYIGYHGTSERNANSIITVTFRAPTNLGWLGCGTYFYDDDLEMAVGFAKNANYGPSIKVIKCILSVDDNRIFDITDPRGPDSKKFHKMRSDYEDAIGAASMKAHGKANAQFEARIFEKICTDEGYKLVRACTYTNNTLERNAHFPLAFSKFANGVELCLRDVSCVKNKEII